MIGKPNTIKLTELPQLIFNIKEKEEQIDRLITKQVNDTIQYMAKIR
jgi:hypothetical protein